MRPAGVCGRPDGDDRAVILSLTLRRAILAAPAVLALTWSTPHAAYAQAPTGNHLTTAGSFLAAQHASHDHDAAAAATFYRSALRADPGNNELLDRTFLSVLLNGDVDEAVRLAERVLRV